MIDIRAVLAAVACASAQMVAYGDSSDATAIYDELVYGTTNAWGVGQTAFRNVSNTNMMRLAKIGTAEARTYGREWLRTLSGLPIPTNTPATYRLWLGEKSAWLRGASRRYLDADCTNLWYAVADALGRLRDCKKSEADIAQAYQAGSSSVTAVDVGSGFPSGYYEEIRVLMAQEEASTAIGSIVVNWFGRYGLPRLPAEERTNVSSNLFIRARLTATERQKLESYIR